MRQNVGSQWSKSGTHELKFTSFCIARTDTGLDYQLVQMNLSVGLMECFTCVGLA